MSSESTGANRSIPHTCCLLPSTLLLSTIYKHFCGPLENTKWQHREALLNLRISTLRDYEWYKQNFLSRIYFLDDFNSAIWKDKLIAGLPKAFSDLVRAKLGNMNLAEATYKERRQSGLGAGSNRELQSRILFLPSIWKRLSEYGWLLHRTKIGLAIQSNQSFNQVRALLTGTTKSPFISIGNSLRTSREPVMKSKDD